MMETTDVLCKQRLKEYEEKIEKIEFSNKFITYTICIDIFFLLNLIISCDKNYPGNILYVNKLMNVTNLPNCVL